MKKITLIFFLFAMIISVNAQSVANYQFSESLEPYQVLNGIPSSAQGDDGTQNNINIGFSFNFDGTIYNTFSISTNGWIKLGQAITGNTYVNLLSNSNAYSPMIAPFFDDHNAIGGIISYQLSGTAPDRKLEVDWNNIRLSSPDANSTNSGSFKLRISETTNEIAFIYGNLIAANGSASVGVNGLTSFLSVTPGQISTVSSASANNLVVPVSLTANKKFVFSEPIQCSGVPEPGNTISSSNQACNLNTIILSIQNNFNFSGYSAQWEKSTDGISYVQIANETNLSLSTSIEADTYFRCLVSCESNSAYSTPILITLTPLTECYCDPVYTVGKTFGDLISNVTIAGTTLANDSGVTPINPAYTYFSGQPNYTATLQAGFTYPVSITVGTYQDQNIAIWIDYNDDAEFSSNERIGYTETEIGANGTSTIFISLDCNAIAGSHRMRIRDVYAVDAIEITPCGSFQYGETEDYDINISDANTCQNPLGLSVSNVNSTSAQLSWQSGCGQISWDVNVALQGSGTPTGIPSNPDVVSGLIVTNLLSATVYEFYVRATCIVGGVSEWTGPYIFMTFPAAVANDDCENAAILTVGSTFLENEVLATNAGATKSIGQPNPTCGIFGFGGDVWFAVEVPSSGNVTLETRPVEGSLITDTVLSAYTGTCGNLTTISCNDDIGPTSFSQLNLTGLQPLSIIYARVWEYANDVAGEFYISAFSSILKNETFDSSKLNYFPNPVTDYINLTHAEKIDTVTIYNLTGQQILTKIVNQDQTRFDLSDLSAGIYLLKINSGKQSEYIKIIKQ